MTEKQRLKADLLAKLEAAQEAADAMAWGADSAEEAAMYIALAAALDGLASTFDALLEKLP